MNAEPNCVRISYLPATPLRVCLLTILEILHCFSPQLKREKFDLIFQILKETQMWKASVWIWGWKKFWLQMKFLKENFRKWGGATPGGAEDEHQSSGIAAVSSKCWLNTEIKTKQQQQWHAMPKRDCYITGHLFSPAHIQRYHLRKRRAQIW